MSNVIVNVVQILTVFVNVFKNNELSQFRHQLSTELKYNSRWVEVQNAIILTRFELRYSINTTKIAVATTIELDIILKLQLIRNQVDAYPDSRMQL